ncbi:MAG: hypothetical protein ACI4MA_04775 [Treponema sp.]
MSNCFFDDKGGNLGFSWDGLFEEPKEAYDKYHMDKKQYDDDLMRKAIKNVEAGNYSVLGSKFGKLIQKEANLIGKNFDDKIVGTGKKSNCQDWASRVRKEYKRLFKELPESEQKRIKTECKEREISDDEFLFNTTSFKKCIRLKLTYNHLMLAYILNNQF